MPREPLNKWKFSVFLVFCLVEFLFACYGVLQLCDRSARLEELKFWKEGASTLNSELTECSLLSNYCSEKILELEGVVQNKQIVTLSFYHPWSRGINSDENPNTTAIMTKPVVGRTVAISPELFDKGWLGCKVYIEGFGVFIAEDRMASSITGNCIDVCVASKDRAFQLGVKKGVVAVRLQCS